MKEYLKAEHTIKYMFHSGAVALFERLRVLLVGEMTENGFKVDDKSQMPWEFGERFMKIVLEVLNGDDSDKAEEALRDYAVKEFAYITGYLTPSEDAEKVGEWGVERLLDQDFRLHIFASVSQSCHCAVQYLSLVYQELGDEEADEHDANLN